MSFRDFWIVLSVKHRVRCVVNADMIIAEVFFVSRHISCVQGVCSYGLHTPYHAQHIAPYVGKLVSFITRWNDSIAHQEDDTFPMLHVGSAGMRNGWGMPAGCTNWVTSQRWLHFLTIDEFHKPFRTNQVHDVTAWAYVYGAFVWVLVLYKAELGHLMSLRSQIQ